MNFNQQTKRRAENSVESINDLEIGSLLRLIGLREVLELPLVSIFTRESKDAG